MLIAPPIVDVFETSDSTRICFAEWPASSALPFVAAHGLASHHRSLAGIARGLAGTIPAITPDLRGRGNSSTPAAGSYGIARHARDILELMDWLGLDRAVVGGHSMGSYVALAVAQAAADRVAGLVLIDGGVWIGEDDPSSSERSQQQLEDFLNGLSTRSPTPEAYLDRWRAHPAFGRGLNEEGEASLLYGLGPVPGGYAAKCSAAAAREDLADIWRADRMSHDLLSSLRCPVLAIGAEYGLMMGPESLLGDRHFVLLRSLVTDVETVTVPGSDHHSIVLSPQGAEACAGAIRKFLARLN